MATALDLVLERGTTAVIPYPVTLAGVADNLASAIDIRFVAKFHIDDADSAAAITKTLIASQITLDSGTHSIVSVPILATDTDLHAAAFTGFAGDVLLYLGLRAYLPGSPEVVYGLFRDPTTGQPIVPTLLLTLGGGQAIT